MQGAFTKKVNLTNIQVYNTFIQKFTPLSFPSFDESNSYSELFDLPRHHIFVLVYTFRIQHLTLLASKPATAAHIVKMHHLKESRMHFAGNQNFWDYCWSHEKSDITSDIDYNQRQIIHSNVMKLTEWLEFLHSLSRSFAITNQHRTLFLISNHVNNQYSMEQRNRINPFGERCAQMRELARVSIWNSLINNRDAECASQNSSSLSSTFRQLGLPQLLVSYLEFQ